MHLKTILLIAGMTLLVAGPARSDPASPPDAGPDLERSFLAENATAMDRMMAGMAVQPSGDVGRDFTAMMIPHHQGAIDMAQAYLRHGTNEQLRRIAQEIIVEQQQEIAAMRLAIGDPLPPSAPAPTQIRPDQLPTVPTESASHPRHRIMPN